MVMEILWSLYVLVVLFSVDAAHSHKGSRGLSCVNDFVNNVSCTWNGSPLAPGANCLISGLKKTRILRNNKRLPSQMIRTCKVEQHGNSPPGCSFIFENNEFNRFKDMPYISMECDGKLIENLTNYKPCNHIKMNPPGVPSVNRTVNETWISWCAGSPHSIFITSFDFQVQIKQISQKWEEASNLTTQELKLKIPSWKLKGLYQVRVRVYPTQWNGNSHWSNWSPTTSWVGATDMATSQDQEKNITSCNEWPPQIWAWMFIISLVLVVTLLLYSRCVSKGLHKVKPVPNPSKYFHTLHSVHGGNLKKWLNPLSAPESFFTAQPCNHISPVELCESSDVVPSSSPSSNFTSALPHFRSYPSAASETSGVAENSSSSSSSCFSNMGYFLSSSSSSSSRSDPNPAYFTYQEDFHNLHNSHNLHLALWPSFNTSPTYESLKREPQSPDSGFGTGKEDQEVVDLEGEEVSDDHRTSPLLTHPLRLPSQMCPPLSPPPSPNAPSLTQVCSDSQQVDTTVAAASGSCTAWPLTVAMCRSSSMPVEPCRAGYLTLKDLQTTFSNKSI